MRYLRELICTAGLVLAAAAGYFLLVGGIFGSDTGIPFRLAGYAVVIVTVAAAAMMLVLGAETVLLAASKILRRRCSVPFAALFSGANFLLFLLSICVIIDDLLIPHPQAILSLKGLGTELMLLTLTPISLIFAAVSLAVCFRRRKRRRS